MRLFISSLFFSLKLCFAESWQLSRGAAMNLQLENQPGATAKPAAHSASQALKDAGVWESRRSSLHHGPRCFLEPAPAWMDRIARKATRVEVHWQYVSLKAMPAGAAETARSRSVVTRFPGCHHGGECSSLWRLIGNIFELLLFSFNEKLWSYSRIIAGFRNDGNYRKICSSWLQIKT